MTRRIRTLSISSVAIMMLLVSCAVHPSYFLLYNPSESAPRGWYVIAPAHSFNVHDFVLIHLPASVARFASERGYLPSTVPLLKQISAQVGAHVCEQNGELMIDGHFVARARQYDGVGRVLTAWSGCRTLNQSELFLLNRQNDASFDSRYFGPIDDARVIGRAEPLWTW